MSNAIVGSIYNQVIGDVIENVKKDFEDMGVDKEVLKDLQISWIQKVRSSRVAPWEGDAFYPEASETPQLKDERLEAATNLTMLASPPNMSNSIETPKTHLYIPTKNGSVPASTPFVATHLMTNTVPAQNQSLVDQQNPDQKIYSAPPSQTQELETFIEQKIPESSMLVTHSVGDYSTSPQVPTAIQQPIEDSRRSTGHNGSSYADDDEINSDLDDPDEDGTAENEDSQNIILCLYDKVTRTKNKWKCQLKDGVMSVNGKDYLFHKGTGDFEF